MSSVLIRAQQYLQGLRDRRAWFNEQAKMIRVLVAELEKYERGTPDSGSIKKPKARPKYLAHAMPKIRILKDESWSIDRRDPTLDPEEI